MWSSTTSPCCSRARSRRGAPPANHSNSIHKLTRNTPATHKRTTPSSSRQIQVSGFCAPTSMTHNKKKNTTVKNITNCICATIFMGKKKANSASRFGKGIPTCVGPRTFRTASRLAPARALFPRQRDVRDRRAAALGAHQHQLCFRFWVRSGTHARILARRCREALRRGGSGTQRR
jgi:hypothetical protein